MVETTLKLAGRDLKCVLGLGFIGELLEAIDLRIEEVGIKVDKNPFKMVPLLIYHSAKYTIEDLEGGEVDFKLTDVIKWVEESGGVGSSESIKFLQAFTKSMTHGVPKNEDQKEEASKKK